MRIGTLAMLGLAALDAALDVWEGVSIQDVRAKSIELSELVMQALVDEGVVGDFRPPDMMRFGTRRSISTRTTSFAPPASSGR